MRKRAFIAVDLRLLAFSSWEDLDYRYYSKSAAYQEKLAETFVVDSSDFSELVLLLKRISFLFGSHRTHIPYGAISPEVLPYTSGPSSVTMAQRFGFIKYTLVSPLTCAQRDYTRLNFIEGENENNRATYEVGRVGFEPTTPAMSRLVRINDVTDAEDINTKFWKGFESFLKQTNNQRSTRDRFNYARNYFQILEQSDASELLELTGEKRIHVMKSLAALAKYTGRYDKWQQIRQRFQLKWSGSDSLQHFSFLYNNGKDLDYMLKWIKDTYSRLPQKYANVLMFNTLTGLRPSEACNAITLIHTDLDNYVNRATHTLEHFKFPCFIRRTKKAYISIYNDRIMEIAKNAQNCTYPSLKNTFRKYRLPLQTSFCRKIFATYLRLEGIEQEIIDLLQGRIPRNVFVRHYFRPNFAKENEKVSTALETLHEKIRDTI